MNDLIEKYTIGKAVVKVWVEHMPDWGDVVQHDELSQVVVEVVVFDSSGWVEGTDVLGCVEVSDSTFREDVMQAVETNSMIDNARDDLKMKLNQIMEGIGR